LIFQMYLTKNKPMEKESILTEGAKRYWELSTRLTLLEKII